MAFKKHGHLLYKLTLSPQVDPLPKVLSAVNSSFVSSLELLLNTASTRQNFSLARDYVDATSWYPMLYGTSFLSSCFIPTSYPWHLI